MDACNHSTFSQAMIKTVSEAGINFNHVISIVTDNAAYCKKAYQDVPSALYPNSLHVLCIAHVVNLVSEVFHHKYTSNLISMIKSSLCKKPGRKSRFLKFLGEYIATSEVKLPSSSCIKRWNSWYKAASYHTIYELVQQKPVLEKKHITCYRISHLNKGGYT